MSWQFHPTALFARHAPGWDVLQRATTNTPFLEALFIVPLLEQFGTGRELLALHTGSQGIDAATLVRPVGQGMWQTFQPSQLPLGPWLAAPGDDLEHRMRSLLAALPGLVLGLGVTQLDPRLQALPAESDHLRLLDYIVTPYLDIEGSFDAYWESRGKNLRQNTRKQHNKLAAEGLAPTLECVTDPAEVADALADYGALESAGWKAGTGTAIQAENAQGRFYCRMLENFCAEGRGRIYRYRFGEKVVSMDLCIDNGPLVVILKTTYDEGFRAVSPSVLMRHEQFRAWWNEGRYKRIEFYGPTMEWHTRWTGVERQLYHANTYRWPLLRRVHDQLRALRSSPAPAATVAP